MSCQAAELGNNTHREANEKSRHLNTLYGFIITLSRRKNIIARDFACDATVVVGKTKLAPAAPTVAVACAMLLSTMSKVHSKWNPVWLVGRI